MAKPQPAGALTFLPEPRGEEIPQTNIETEEALQTLLDALEARKKPRFDPRMLALAQGFLGPSRTGSAFEGIGRAIGKYQEADELERQRDVEYAQQRLGVVGQMAEIERRRQRDRDFENVFGARQDPVQAEIGQEVDGSDRFAPPGISGIQGVKVMEGNPALLTYRRNFNAKDAYLRSLYKEGKVSLSEALKQEQEFQAKAMEMQRKRYEVRDDGVLDLATGLRYAFSKGDLVERQIVGIPGVSGTYKIPSNIAQQMDVFQALGDREGYERAARRALHLEDEKAPDREGAPSVAPTKPSPIKSEAEKEVEKIERETIAKKEAELSVETEAALGSNAKSAREMFNASQRLQKAVTESPLVFGVLQTPGLGTSILSLIDEGIRAGNTSISLGGLQSSIIRAIPGVTAKDIVNLERAYSALAELELKYTQLYLKGQGQVTEGERLIVRKLAGTEKNSAEFLRTQAKLIEMRSQFDIDVIDAFRRAKTANPGLTWLRFERSDAYRRMQQDYDKKLGKEIGVEPAVPSGEKKDSGSKETDTSFSVDAFKGALEKRSR